MPSNCCVLIPQVKIDEAMNQLIPEYKIFEMGILLSYESLC